MIVTAHNPNPFWRDSFEFTSIITIGYIACFATTTQQRAYCKFAAAK
jgi:hypothetical protein